ncbi:MAG: FAD-binding oxidoreductase [Rhodobacteraceae bacterium]|nr:FAD-binding oxidoreductase [Paracoccaceae bacterium]
MRWNETEYAGWGRVQTAHGEIARPERVSSLEAILSEGSVPAMGKRRSYNDACLNSGGRAIDMTRLDRIISFDADKGVLEAEAGITIGSLARIFAPLGWLPKIMPGTGFATLGGAIAQDVHGKNHQVSGSFGQHVLSVTLLTSGKRVIATPSRNKALFKATMGGVGQTGVILSAKIQMKPCPGEMVMVTERRAEGWDEFLSMLDTSTATYSVGWIDTTARGDALGRGTLEEGELAAGNVLKHKGTLSVPINAPGFALSAPVVRAFNSAYYHKVPVKGRTSVKPLDEFFFPLDKIRNWNRLYGKRGFYQFQTVVPTAQAPALREMLKQIAGSSLFSPLAVLKRMGPGRAGHLSFPMEGYSLAVDIPNRRGAQALVSELERATVAAGGRIYLAKDALASGDAVKAMYPEQGEWAEIVNKADPEHALETDMTRRLNLRSTT